MASRACLYARSVFLFVMAVEVLSLSLLPPHLMAEVEKAMEGVVKDRAVGSLTRDRLKGCDNCSPLGNIKIVDAERKSKKM